MVHTVLLEALKKVFRVVKNLSIQPPSVSLLPESLDYLKCVALIPIWSLLYVPKASLSSTPLLAAKASADVGSSTWFFVAQSIAITSPSQSRARTLIPTLFLDLSTDASQLTLMDHSGGLHQWLATGFLGVCLLSCSCFSAKEWASSWSLEIRRMVDGERNFPSKTIEFLLSQICLATMATRFISSSLVRCINNSIILIKSVWSQVLLLTRTAHSAKTSWAEGQLHKMCYTDSTSKLQIGHKGSGVTCFLNKFSLVAKMLLHAFHISVLTALETPLLHIVFHKPRLLSLLEQLPLSTSKHSLTKWYALRTM